ncbi:MAG: DUF1592 domain-containing protein [Verrucomicrobiales bacterium]|nr:DUF1592 domain-containing protein [Verrucomicrobiales bacterium]
MSTKIPQRLLAGLLAGGLLICGAFGSDSVDGFLATHCFDCHDADTEKGDFRLDNLDTSKIETGSVDSWSRILARLEAGDMPPPKKPRPAAEEIKGTLKWVKSELAAEVNGRRGAGGAVARRLNRLEYENTVHDLLAIEVPLRELLPEDDYVHGFNTSAEGLRISPVHIQRYLEAVELALDAAIVRGEQPEAQIRRLQFARKSERRFFGQKSKGRMFVLTDDNELLFFCEPGVDKPAYLEQLEKITRKQPGRYRIRIAARTLDDRGDKITFSIRSAAPKQRLGIETLAWWDAPGGQSHEVFQVETRLAAGHTIIISPYRLNDMRRQRGFSQYAPGDSPVLKNRKEQPETLPDPKGLALGIGWIEVEGPLTGEWPPPGHKLLFGDTKMIRFRSLPENLLTPGKLNDLRKGNQLTPHPDDPLATSRQLLTTFLPRAFRRPVEKQEVDVYHDLVRQRLDASECFESAMRSAYRAALCSPDFLFLPGTDGPLDNYTLAARLSYFLHRRPPDDQLREAAGKGNLTEPDELRRQVKRLIDSPLSEAFVEDFTDQWLDLREIHATQPDKHLYPEFYVEEGGKNFLKDDLLVDSMLGETRRFFADLLQNDGSLLRIIDSDYIYANNRLARFYHLPPVSGSALQRVSLPADSVRGGVLTQAAILKVTANGTRTSPVVRGVWVMESILNRKPLPPPPDAGSIDPDTRGTATIREQLAKHQSNQSCASCHRQIDPPGFALECFDPAGTLREVYRTLDGVENLKKRRPQAPPAPGEELRGRDILGAPTYLAGAPVDAGGEIVNGKKFTGPSDFKALLLEEPQVVARALAAKLITYATGRAPEPGDTLELDRIVSVAEQNDYGMQTLLHEVVQSNLFLAR